MTDTDTSAEAVGPLLKDLQWEGSQREDAKACDAQTSAVLGRAAATLRALRAERDHYGSTADARAVCITMLERQRDAAREEAADSRATLSAWFDLAKKAEEAGADVLRDAIGTWLRTSLNGGMPTKHADIVRTAVNEAARLYLWKALVPVLRTIQDEQRDAAQAEVARLREAAKTAADVIENYDREVITDTVWLSSIETLVDYLRTAAKEPGHD